MLEKIKNKDRYSSEETVHEDILLRGKKVEVGRTCETGRFDATSPTD